MVSTSSLVVLSIMNWLHMVALLVWLGGMITTVVFVVPVAESALGRTLGPLAIVSAVKLLTFEGTAVLMVGGLAASGLLYVRLRDIPGRPTELPAAPPWRQAVRSMRPLLVPLSGILIARAFLLASVTTFLPTFMHEQGNSLLLAGAALTIVEAAGVPPHQICYVGDRVDNDVLPAAAAGMITALLRRGPWGLVQAAWPEAQRADIRLDSLDELLPALHAL